MRHKSRHIKLLLLHEQLGKRTGVMLTDFRIFYVLGLQIGKLTRHFSRPLNATVSYLD